MTHSTVEQKDGMAQESNVKVTVTFDVDRIEYDKFRRLFDSQSEREFVSWALEGLLAEVTGGNPSLMVEFLNCQNERLYGNKNEA